ncbi:hypothetical protein [Streptomyces acidicola]|uniref:hypothetical protein n=1 Tax=Streptomyces acidicola TaxID=2596892 RepID=UPI003821D8A8
MVASTLLSCVDSNRTLAAPRRNLGDFDCSGEDIERDWVARTGCWSHTERVKQEELHLMQHSARHPEGRFSWSVSRTPKGAVESIKL